MCWLFWKARQLLAPSRGGSWPGGTAAWVREESSTDTGVLDYHGQSGQDAHEDMMVDEPWDGLKGEVGPVLASVAPSAATDN